MKYKKGDKVRIRPDLSGQVRYYMADKSSWNNCPEEKLVYAGQVVTIASYKKAMGGKQYTIEEDNRYWSWTDEMFEGLVTEPEPQEPQDLFDSLF